MYCKTNCKKLMSTEKFHNKYRVPSSRAAWHDYSGGKYFVTICTKKMEHVFGELLDGKMYLTALGKYADEQLREVSSHYPYAEIPLWVVMPNHIHAVVIIDGEKTPYEKRNVESSPVVETRRATSLQDETITNSEKRMSQRDIADMQGWLSVMIGGMKSSVTKFANQNAIPFAWQPRFHDRIIRTIDEINRVAYYIENNVAQWQCDEFSK